MQMRKWLCETKSSKDKKMSVNKEYLPSITTICDKYDDVKSGSNPTTTDVISTIVLSYYFVLIYSTT